MVAFYFQDTDFKLKHKTRIKNWLKLVAESEIFVLSDISVIFCSDNYILDINQRFLGHDYFTDIITFDTSAYDSELPVHLRNDRLSADIVISLDTVLANASEYSTGFSDELYRVMAHGILHLLGYDDRTEHDAVRMREGEEQALSLATEMGLPFDQIFINSPGNEK